jgi:hypothetical protein
MSKSLFNFAISFIDCYLTLQSSIFIILYLTVILIKQIRTTLLKDNITPPNVHEYKVEIEQHNLQHKCSILLKRV